MALAGCGFAPAFGPGGAGALYGKVAVQEPGNRFEYELVKTLGVRLGQPTAPTHRLAYRVSVAQESTVISAAQELNRFAVKGSATYELVNVETGVAQTGRVSSFTGYSATGSTLATDRSQRDAQDRLMVILGEQIIAQLTLDLAQ